ncbi:UNVERIFIED_CONTAM: hypothetical protein Slati_4171400 [Sesamum latifolium]|uniref:Uncharacterized protein n=1 Tax=Sesamum latifolium TaxID=2727402 RepID=A0AAW2TAK6_9LAMI
MAVNVAPFKLKSIAKDNVAPKNSVPYEKPQRKLTLKEMQARQYPFLHSDVFEIFDDLLEVNLIDLPKMERPEEVERRDDSKYCKYHRLVGHTIQDCFVFKNAILWQQRFMQCHTALGSKPHNRPLLVVEYVREQKVKRILIDGGSAVNILPLRTLKELGVPMDELSNNRLMILGFNQGGQRAIGIIRMELLMDDTTSTAYAKLSYNMLLGPLGCMKILWFLQHDIIASNISTTDSEKVLVIVNLSPKLVILADAKYYIEDAKKEKEVLPSKELKSCGNQSTRKNDSSTIKVELPKDLTLSLTQINLKLPSFKLLIKTGYNPKENLSFGKLPPEATGKKLQDLMLRK